MRIGTYIVKIEKAPSEEVSLVRRKNRRLMGGGVAASLLAIFGMLAWWCPLTLILALNLVHFRSPAVLYRRATALEREALIRQAEAGDAKAQFELFEALSGTAESWKGEQWLTKSARLGYVDAEREMGDRADDAGNHEVAVDWYRKAALQGNGPASTRLGEAYLLGEGVSPDPMKAMSYFVDGARKGDAWAAEELGGCYLNDNCRLGNDFGLLKRDYREACEWLFIARALGNGPTCDSKIQAHLSKSQFDGARNGAELFIDAYQLTAKRADWATAP